MDNLELQKNGQDESMNETVNDCGDEGELEKKFTVRHNKADVRLTLDELIKNAEKGLDYDRIRPSHEYVKALAAKGGESDISRFIAKMKNGQGGDTHAAGNPQPQRNIALSDNEKEVIAKEYPDYVKNGAVELPPEALSLFQSGMGMLDACRAADLKRTKELCTRLSAKLDAQAANRANAAASIGSLSGGEAPQKDYYTSEEWDKLPQKDKEKFIKSGKIYEFMKKWSGK
jgi:hypothetical protein